MTIRNIRYKITKHFVLYGTQTRIQSMEVKEMVIESLFYLLPGISKILLNFGTERIVCIVCGQNAARKSIYYFFCGNVRYLKGQSCIPGSSLTAGKIVQLQVKTIFSDSKRNIAF
jgi:hypothetical protein